MQRKDGERQSRRNADAVGGRDYFGVLDGVGAAASERPVQTAQYDVRGATEEGRRQNSLSGAK